MEKLEGQTTQTEDRFVNSSEWNEAPGDAKNKDAGIEYGSFVNARESPIPSHRVRTNHTADEFVTMRTEDRSNHGTFLAGLSLVASIQRFSDLGFDKREIFFHRRIEERQADAKTQYDDQQAETKQAHGDSPLTNFDRMISLPQQTS